MIDLHMSGETSEFNTPVMAIYILDKSGIPVFARYYQGKIKETDSTLLGGFFSAIETFVKTSLHGLLTDIGMTDRRFFFDRTRSEHIVITSISMTDLTLDLKTFQTVKRLQDTIKICLNILNDMSEIYSMDIEQFIDQLGSTIDSFILESGFEYIDVVSLDKDYFKSIHSEQASDEDLEKIIAQIHKNRI